ncbi:solute carrier organic anion transporter family member 4C1, partial [Trichonephila clavata]
DPGYGPEDPRWIGAWWIGFLLQGVLQLLLTIPLALFPRRLPGQKRLPTNSEAKAKLSSGFKGLIAALKRLLKNPLYLSIVINTIMNIFGSLGHFMMLPKYMELQFRLTASDASLYSGPPGIIAIMLSTLLGGYLVWKYKPNVKSQIATMIILESISAVGYLLLMVPHCEKVQMSHFGLENHGLALEGLCNVNCNCTTKVFTPLCGSDGKTSYFSPCFAGCTENLNKSFSDCSCIMDPDGQGTNSYAKEGFCISLGCWSQALGYIISLPIIQFIASILKVQYTVILVRSINPEDKSIALGLFEALICIF